MSTAFLRRTSRTQSGRSPAALPLPLAFSLRKEKASQKKRIEEAAAKKMCERRTYT